MQHYFNHQTWDSFPSSFPLYTYISSLQNTFELLISFHLCKLESPQRRNDPHLTERKPAQSGWRSQTVSQLTTFRSSGTKSLPHHCHNVVLIMTVSNPFKHSHPKGWSNRVTCVWVEFTSCGRVKFFPSRTLVSEVFLTKIPLIFFSCVDFLDVESQRPTHFWSSLDN